MRRPLLSLLTVALTAATGVSAQAWGPLPEGLAQAEASHVPVLIYVQAPWCGPCRRLDAETFAAPEVAARLAQFAQVGLTIDDRDRHHRVGPYRLSEAAWAARLGAETTPTLIVLAPDGSVLARHTGFLPPAGLLPVLDAALTATARSGATSTSP